MRPVFIANREIGSKFPPFIVAELSANHNYDLNRALKIVEAVKASGAHAIKLQTYTPDTLTIESKNSEFIIKDPKSPWYGKTLYELYKEAQTPWEWHEPIFKRCRELGLIYFSSPFDASAVDFLEALDVPCYKLASLEIVDLPLIKKIASKKKPIIISTGGASLNEIKDAIQVASEEGCEEIILLKCTSAYPAPESFVNLRTIPDMLKTFDKNIGLSDHTLGIGTAVASVALGAVLIEKHVTLSSTDNGIDSAFSLTPLELKHLVIESKRAWESLGEIHYGITDAERSTLSLRRSLYFIKDLKEGEIISENCIKSIRPALGLPPKEYFNILGKKTKRNIKRGEPVSWDKISL